MLKALKYDLLVSRNSIYKRLEFSGIHKKNYLMTKFLNAKAIMSYLNSVCFNAKLLNVDIDWSIFYYFENGH